MRIVWTEPALRDLAFVRPYVGRDNPGVADEQVRRVLAAVAGLPRFPELGRSGRRAATRELAISRTPCIAAYRLSGHSIQILRIMHGWQRWPDDL
jgi:toxin ParE1/3/4